MKYLFFTIVSLILIFCSKKDNRKDSYRLNDTSNDSIIVETYEDGRIHKLHSYIYTPKKILKERIIFKENDSIDYDKSTFFKIKKNDLIFNSLYNKEYIIPQKRYVYYLSNPEIKENFENIDKVKLDTSFFNQSGVIKDFNTKLSRRGKIIEIIFLDSLILINKEEHQKIRTVEYLIDLDKLLIDKLSYLKKKK